MAVRDLRMALTMTWHEVASVEEILPGSGKNIQVQGKNLALFNKGGVFLALENTCLHRGGSLGEGTLLGDEVVCPLHGWTYNVSTGEVKHLPGVRTRTYAVDVKGNSVFVDL